MLREVLKAPKSEVARLAASEKKPRPKKKNGAKKDKVRPTLF